MTANLRQRADSDLKNLFADAYNIPYEGLRAKRVNQIDCIYQYLQELEAYIQHLESENQQTAYKYNHLREVTQRIVHVSESCGVPVHQIGNDVFLTSQRLAKVRANFPHIRLDVIPGKVYDWLVMDEVCEKSEDIINQLNKAA